MNAFELYSQKLNDIKLVKSYLPNQQISYIKVPVTLSRFDITTFMICLSYCTVRDCPRLHNVQIKTK